MLDTIVELPHSGAGTMHQEKEADKPVLKLTARATPSRNDEYVDGKNNPNEEDKIKLDKAQQELLREQLKTGKEPDWDEVLKPSFDKFTAKKDEEIESKIREEGKDQARAIQKEMEEEEKNHPTSKSTKAEALPDHLGEKAQASASLQPATPEVKELIDVGESGVEKEIKAANDNGESNVGAIGADSAGEQKKKGWMSGFVGTPAGKAIIGTLAFLGVAGLAGPPPAEGKSRNGHPAIHTNDNRARPSPPVEHRHESASPTFGQVIDNWARGGGSNLEGYQRQVAERQDRNLHFTADKHRLINKYNIERVPKEEINQTTGREKRNLELQEAKRKLNLFYELQLIELRRIVEDKSGLCRVIGLRDPMNDVIIHYQIDRTREGIDWQKEDGMLDIEKEDKINRGENSYEIEKWYKDESKKTFKKRSGYLNEKKIDLWEGLRGNIALMDQVPVGQQALRNAVWQDAHSWYTSNVRE